MRRMTSIFGGSPKPPAGESTGYFFPFLGSDDIAKFVQRLDCHTCAAGVAAHVPAGLAAQGQHH